MLKKEYKFEIWFIVGCLELYGEEIYNQVKKHAEEMVSYWNEQESWPAQIKLKAVVRSSQEIRSVLSSANYNDDCCGVISWMHTFSPSKMWITGLRDYYKPYLHLNTQFNRYIPWESIDMNFMNLNQSAHGDREHAFIGARLRMPRKIISGYWKDSSVMRRMEEFIRVSIGIKVSKTLKCVRFGDNMRDVAVTEGDKVEAESVFGWSVNYYAVGDLVKYVKNAPDEKTDAIYDIYKQRYDIKTDDLDAIRYQAQLEAGLRSFMEEGGFTAFTSTFEDLYGLEQLEGLAAQNMMMDAYGYGAEGDWKTACLMRVMKVMAEGTDGGTSFMEDYTYHMEPGNESVLGAHMLEVCPSIAAGRPTIEVHPLSIGNRKPPARLVFDGKAGPAVLVSLVDMGGRMRLIVNDCQAITPQKKMPMLPVARVMWKPEPNLQTSAEAWMLCGGAHHTVMSYALNVNHLRDFAEMIGLEFLHIHNKTDVNDLKKELKWNEVAYRLNIRP